MTEMSVNKSVVKSNIMLRLICCFLTLYVDVTFGDGVYRQLVDKVLDSPTFVSEISVVLNWCNLSTVRDVWNPSSFVTSKCNRKLPAYDNSTVLNFSVDFDFDSLLCTSLYDSSAGACHLAHISNRVDISNLMPDRPIPVADKFCNDAKSVLAHNASIFVNVTRLWVEAFNKNMQDERKCTKECIAGEKINPLCKAVVKVNSIILRLYNEVPQTHQSDTGNILKEPPPPPEKSGNLRAPSLDTISPGSSGLADISAGAITQLQNDMNISGKRPPVNAPSSSSSKDKGLRGLTVQNDSEQASKQLNGTKQKLHGNARMQNEKASDSIGTEKGELESVLPSGKKTETHSINDISKKFNGTHDKLAANRSPVKPGEKTATPGSAVNMGGKKASGSDHPSAPSVNNDNTQQHMQDSSDDDNGGVQSGALPVPPELVQKPFQPQNIGDETQPVKQPKYGKEPLQLPNEKKISEDKPEVLPPTTVSTENLDKAQKMDSSVATGVSNPATVNSQFQDTAQRDSTDETYPEPERIDPVSDVHTLEDDDVDDDDILESAPDREENVPPVAGEGVLVSRQRTVSKASFPIQDTAEEGNAEFVKTEDSHFFAYFMTMIVLCIIGYLVFHNKQKILALALEGRSRRGSRRRPNTAGYRKLDSNLEEAVTSQCSSASVTHVIY